MFGVLLAVMHLKVCCWLGAGVPDESLLTKVGTPRSPAGAGRPGRGQARRAAAAAHAPGEEEDGTPPGEADVCIRAQLAVWHLRTRLQRELALQVGCLCGAASLQSINSNQEL
jgi:hypothetical protein